MYTRVDWEMWEQEHPPVVHIQLASCLHIYIYIYSCSLFASNSNKNRLLSEAAKHSCCYRISVEQQSTGCRDPLKIHAPSFWLQMLGLIGGLSRQACYLGLFLCTLKGKILDTRRCAATQGGVQPCRGRWSPEESGVFEATYYRLLHLHA